MIAGMHIDAGDLHFTRVFVGFGRFEKFVFAMLHMYQDLICKKRVPFQPVA